MAIERLLSPVADEGQSYIYYATYFNGERFLEYDEDTNHYNFGDIKKDQVKYFGFIGNSMNVYWDIPLGVFHIGKQEYFIDIKDRNTGNSISYIDTAKSLITFKEAHTDSIGTGNTLKPSEQGNIIDAFFIGFKMNTDNAFIQILFSIPMTFKDRRPFFAVRISNKLNNSYTAELIGLNGEDRNRFSRRDIDLKDGKSSAVELRFN